MEEELRSRGLADDQCGAEVEPPPPTVEQTARTIPTTCIEHAYGSTYRLSFQIKVF